MTKVNMQESSTSNIGLWIYLMTDIMLFASLFATFMVLRNNVAGGPSGSEIFNMPYILVETFILLYSSLMVGLAYVSARHGRKRATIAYLVVGLLAGISFLGMELWEFAVLVNEGHSWQQSAFLSSYFTLVGTHGLHIFVGILWGMVILYRLLRGSWGRHTMRKLGLFVVFWHFLELVWIFIFSIVYLIGGHV